MSLEVEDSDFQRILLASLADARPSDDAALARVLQLQEDALGNISAPLNPFGNAGTPNNPIVITGEEDVELMKAVEESLKVKSPTASSVTRNTLASSFPPSNTTQPPIIRYPSFSTTPTQLQAPPIVSPRTSASSSTTTTTTSSSAPLVGSMDGLASMLGNLTIANEKKKTKDNKPIKTTSTSTKVQNSNDTNTNTNSSGNSGDVGNTIDTNNTSTHAITTSPKNVRTAVSPDGRVRRILVPKRLSRKSLDDRQPTTITSPTQPPVPSSDPTPTLSPTSTYTPMFAPSVSTVPQNSQPPPRATSNVNTNRQYAYTTYHTSPTNNNINIAADLNTPFNPSVLSPTPTQQQTNNMYNSYSTNLQATQRQNLPPTRQASYIPPTSRLLATPSSIPPSTNSTTNLANSSNSSNPANPANSANLANTSNFANFVHPTNPVNPSNPAYPAHPATPAYHANPANTNSSAPANPQRNQHRTITIPFNSVRNAGNVGNARAHHNQHYAQQPTSYVSYVGRLGSANEPENTIEDDEAFAQRLQLQEALQLQHEYDAMSSGRRSNRSDPVAQLLRYQELLQNQRGWRYGDTGSDFEDEDDEYDSENDVDHMTYEQLLALEDRIGSVPRGASKTEIEVCPKYVLTAEHSVDNKTCLVCHDEIVVGNEVRRLPCLHIYHVDCIDTWLTQKPTCPVCLHTVKNE